MKAFLMLFVFSFLLLNSLFGAPRNVISNYDSSESTVDLAVTSITAPITGDDLGVYESVTVTIENFGNVAQANIPVRFNVNNGNYVYETCLGPIPAGGAVNYTFSTVIDLSVNGDYTICAQTMMQYDAVSSNDELCTTITKLSCAPFSDQCDLEGIKQLQLGTINVDDGGVGCNTELDPAIKGYADRTNLSTTLSRTSGNNTHELKVQTNAQVAASNTLSMWIDFNDDKVFESTEKLIDNVAFSITGGLEVFNFTIPVTAALGKHRMRVRAGASISAAVNDPCANGLKGETQDYLVEVVDVLSVGDDEHLSETITITYLSGNQYSIAFTENIKESKRVAVFNLLGQLINVANLKVDEKTYVLDLSNFKAGMYLIQFIIKGKMMTKRVVVK